jgi:hypothetical protein
MVCSEGDFIKKEIPSCLYPRQKEEYMDPNLVQNTKNQMDAKKQSQQSYG